jgi:fumarate reductase flavoprotein subunit
MENNGTIFNKKPGAEIIVVGGGGAGLAAAVAAGETGAKVILVEKLDRLGGNSVNAEGIFGAGSQLQKRLNIDADRDMIFKKAMDRDHWRLDSRIVRAFIDKSADTIHWLEKKGLTFNLVRYYPNQVPVVFHCFIGGGAAYVKVMAKYCIDLNVQTLLQTSVKELMADKNGRIIGIIAVKDGRKIRINSKSVIITTGGFGGNKELLKKYCSYYAENMKCYGLPHMGDGLLIATTKKAAMADMGNLHMGGPDWITSTRLRSLPWEPNLLWVNKFGERFTDENLSFTPHWAGNSIIRQPGQICYALFDERIKSNLMNIGVIKGRGTRIPPMTKLTYLDEELQNSSGAGGAKIADTWEEIAKWMGAKPEILQSTVAEYNNFCRQGHDAIFAKDPRYLEAMLTSPYYAVRCGSGFLQTMGGIKINFNMEVMREDHSVIPGLFAAGSDTSGWSSDTYNLEMTGEALGYAINSGRIAGENASLFARTTAHPTG